MDNNNSINNTNFENNENINNNYNGADNNIILNNIVKKRLFNNFTKVFGFLGVVLFFGGLFSRSIFVVILSIICLIIAIVLFISSFVYHDKVMSELRKDEQMNKAFKIRDAFLWIILVVLFIFIIYYVKAYVIPLFK